MKKRLLILLSLLLHLTAYSQDAKPITDSTLFFAIVTKGTYMYAEPTVSSKELAPLEKEKRILAVSYRKHVMDFLYVVSDSVKGYVPLDDVFIPEDKAAFLKSRNEEGQDTRLAVAARADRYVTYMRLLEAKKLLDKYKKQGLVITEWDFYEPDEITGAVNVEFRILNPMSKPVKYVWFSVAAYNPVGDRTGNVITVKGIGPVGQWESAGWSFDGVWYNKTIEKVRITQVKVQYMDGTIRLFSKPGLIMGGKDI